jgi:hypothetical protein
MYPSESINTTPQNQMSKWNSMGSTKQEETVVTSMKVDKELWKEAKKKAIDKGMTLQELLNDAVKEWMANNG